MRKFIINMKVKQILSVIFIFFILHTGLAAIPDVIGEISEILKSEKHDFITIKRTVDKIYMDGMLSTKLGQPLWQNKGTYINLNGLMAKLMGQQYMNKIVLMENKHLTFYNEQNVDVQPAVVQMTKLFEKQAEREKDFLFVLAPMQISKYDSQMPIGYQEDKSNEMGDLLLNGLRKNDVPVLDLREKMYEQGISYTDAFFKADHHWKPQTGFWAYTEIIKQLREMGVISESLTFYTDLDQYEFKKFENCLLGSTGKRTGKYYAGVDDMWEIIPKFETDMSMKIPSIEVNNSGRFEDVIYNESSFEKIDYFNGSAYDAYVYGDRGLSNFYNEMAPVEKRVLLIGDSFTRVTSPLLALCFDRCDKMEMRHYEGDFVKYYTEFEPELIIVLVNTCIQNAQLMGLNTTYDFFPDEEV